MGSPLRVFEAQHLPPIRFHLNGSRASIARAAL